LVPQQVGSYLGYTGRGANFGKAARDPMQTFFPIEEPRPKPQSQYDMWASSKNLASRLRKHRGIVGQSSPNCEYAPFARNALKRLSTTIVKA
jgi:hypothetical protein